MSTRLLMLLCLFVVLLSFVSPNDGWSFSRPRVHVHVGNYLVGNLDLRVHCKDKHVDWGLHVVKPGQNYTFDFVPNFWGTTLYFCTFQWSDVTRWFDIYEEARDVLILDCAWKITQSWNCMYNKKTGQYDLCYDWQKRTVSSSSSSTNPRKHYLHGR